MNESLILATLSVVGVLFGVLIGMIGWVTSRIVGRLDRLTDFLHGDIRDILHAVDKRLASLESWRNSLPSAPPHQ